MVRGRATCPSLFRQIMNLYDAILLSQVGKARATYRGCLIKATCYEDPLLAMFYWPGKVNPSRRVHLWRLHRSYQEDLLALDWRPVGKQLSALEVLAKQGENGTEDTAATD